MLPRGHPRERSRGSSSSHPIATEMPGRDVSGSQVTQELCCPHSLWLLEVWGRWMVPPPPPQHGSRAGSTPKTAREQLQQQHSREMLPLCRAESDCCHFPSVLRAALRGWEGGEGAGFVGFCS